MKECLVCHLCYDDHEFTCPADGSTLKYTLPGGVEIADKYRLESLLTRGSMGSIYCALQQDLQRRVAIKVLNPQLLASNIARERFRREAVAIASLKHPNIVTVYDFGANPYGLFYIVMELLEGHTLADRLEGEKRLEVTVATQIAIETCDALAQAHARGIIHRDLKPSNIFLVAGNTPVTKVIDFGLVKLKEHADAFQNITAGALIGSLHYSAPEQCRSTEIDARADIYSLGVILYHMLTGRRPFDAPNKAQVIYQQLNAKPLPLHRIIFDIPPMLETAVLKALEKDPAARYQTIGEFAAVLRQSPKRGARRTVGMFISGPLVRSAEQVRQEFQQASQRAMCFEHFIARRRELAKVRLVYEQVCESKSTVMLISGDPGIGKTELLSESVKNLSTEGALCFSGQFSSSRLTLPWSMTAVRNYLQQLLQGDSIRFNKIFGSLAAAVQDAISTQGSERTATTAAFMLQSTDETQVDGTSQLLAQIYLRLSEYQPVVLALDDLQLADPASLKFLIYLIGVTTGARVLFLFSARAQEIAQPENQIAHWLDRVANQRQLQRLQLGPLSSTDVRLLIEKIFEPVVISEEAVTRLCQVTEGNPFHLTNVLRVLAEQGQISWDGQQWQCGALTEIKIPPTVARLIEARLQFLSEQSREVLKEATILGEMFSFEILKRSTGFDEDNLMSVIDDGLRYGLLREAHPSVGGLANDDYYSFAQHALFQVLYDQWSISQRQSKHRQVAELFAKFDTTGQESRQWQYIEAAHQFLLAGETAQAFCYQVAAAGAAWRAGETALARQHLQTASSLVEQFDIAALLAPKGELIKPDTLALASHFCDYLMLCAELKLSNTPAQIEEWLEKALLLAQRIDDPILIARALVASGHYQQQCADYQRALSYFERALALYQEVGDKKRYHVIIEQITALRAKVKPHQPTVDII
ncbi:MAG: protein kinase [Acidobacteriota bacterium]